MPAGLGARDTLRLEAALPLHGHELGPGITPLQAGLGWVVAWGKETFRGRAALAAERERGVHRHLVGIATEGRRPPRAECPILVDGEVVGVVTSGNFSPVLGHGIALGFVPPDARATARRSTRRRARHRAGGPIVADAVRRAADARVSASSARWPPASCAGAFLAGAFFLAARLLGRRLLGGAFRGGAGVGAGGGGATVDGAIAAAGDVAGGSSRGCAARTARRPTRRSGRAGTADGRGR